VNELAYFIWGITITTRFLGAGKQSVAWAAQFPVGGASSDAAKLQIAIAAKIKALANLQVALAEPKGQFPVVCRVPEQGSGRGGCGNASGEKDFVRQSGLPELIACRGTGNPRPGEEDMSLQELSADLDAEATATKVSEEALVEPGPAKGARAWMQAEHVLAETTAGDMKR
jgi:hypothetical protein